MASGSDPRPLMRWETTSPSLCNKKDETDWRIVSLNVNNFPSENDGEQKAKRDALRREIAMSEGDIMGFTEIGRNENKLTHHHKPSNIIKRWLEKGAVISDWNRRQNYAAYEAGGSLTPKGKLRLIQSKEEGTAGISGGGRGLL